MTEPTKYLIVSLNHTDYTAVIARAGYDPGRCFQCESETEAALTAAKNAAWGIPCEIVTTPEWVMWTRLARERKGAAA